MSPQTASRKHGRHHVSISAASTLLALALGCAAASGVAPPTVPWSQTAVTAAAAAFAGQIDALYETAIKDPSFAGERSAHGQTLDELRVLREESRGLQAKLDAGKTREQTLHSWERIKELTRDLRESESWDFVPTDLAASAKAALGSTQQLGGFYGAY
jgi:hypothetical protein